MTAIIHKITVGEFKALSPENRTGFLADIAAEWVGAGENGETAMPPSYSRLFERRVAQEAAMRGSTPEDTMADILTLAEALDETGDSAMAHRIGAIDALWINDDDAEAPTEAPTAPAKPRAARKPKVVAEPTPAEDTVEMEAPQVFDSEPETVEPETPEDPPIEVEPETPNTDPAEVPTEDEPETLEPAEAIHEVVEQEPTHLDEVANAIQALVGTDPEGVDPEPTDDEDGHIIDIDAHRRAAAEAI